MRDPSTLAFVPKPNGAFSRVQTVSLASMAVAQLVATTLLSSFLRVHSLPVTSFDEAARYTTLSYGDGAHIARENIPAAAAAWQTAIQSAIVQQGETIMIQTMFWPVEIQVHTCVHTSGHARVCMHTRATLGVSRTRIRAFPHMRSAGN